MAVLTVQAVNNPGDAIQAFLVSEAGYSGTLTATISDSSIAYVLPTTQTGDPVNPVTFTVYGTSNGTCDLVISDGTQSLTITISVTSVTKTPVSQGITAPPPSSNIAFGNFSFPITFQETNRSLKLALDKKHVPFNWGDHSPGNTMPNGREIQIKGPVGSMVKSFAQNIVMSDQGDLEQERRLLAMLQNQGRQLLQWSFPDGTAYACYAFLEQFDFKFFQDAFGFRYADWELKFWADDPRFVSLTATTVTDTGATSPRQVAVNSNGTVRTYPTVTFNFTVNGHGPYVAVQNGSLIVEARFSGLYFSTGDTLVIDCDPRPNHRSVGAIYTPSGGTPVNAFPFCAITDFTNNWDFTEWLPFIDPSLTGNELVHGCSSGGYNLSASFYDRWL